LLYLGARVGLCVLFLSDLYFRSSVACLHRSAALDAHTIFAFIFAPFSIRSNYKCVVAW
jgi:hypothetical protein